MSPFRNIFAVTLAGSLLLPATFASATQTTLDPIAPPSTVQGELLQMAGQAGVIFVGEVLSITPHPSFTPGTGIVEIAFRVDQPIRGCEGQATYTLREWSGLWTGGRQRYIPGQRLLILLHAPSASGLSSPVGGQDGVIPITGNGVAPKPSDTTIAQAEPTVDLRWVQARLPRAAAVLQSGRLHSLGASAVSAGREHSLPTGRRIGIPGVLRSLTPSPTPSLIESAKTLPLSSSGQGISLRSILTILGAWQAQQNDASH